MELNENELLVPVNHFSKEVYSTFGTPFLIKIIHVSCKACFCVFIVKDLFNLHFFLQEETLADVKERIVNKTGIPDKELEKVS